MQEDRALLDISLPKLKSERDERVRDLVNRLELDLLVVLSSGARGQRGNVRYLANYATTSQSSCVLWAREGAPRLIVPYPVHHCWAEATSWIKDIQTEANYARAIASFLQECGPKRAKLGWVGPPFLLEGLRSQTDALSLRIENQVVQDLFAQMRLVKTPEELNLVHRCAQIADEVLRTIEKAIRPGTTERDLVAEAEYVARRLGAEGTSILVSRGTKMAQPIPQDTALQQGDVLQFSIEPEGPGGIWVQTVRMYALGEPSEDWRQLIAAGVEGEKRAATLLRDGCHASDVAQAMSALLPGEVPLVTPLGHGIGLDNSEPPRISTVSADTLSAGMAIVLHPTEYGKKAAVFLGNTYLIETHGAERLSRIPSDIIVI